MSDNEFVYIQPAIIFSNDIAKLIPMAQMSLEPIIDSGNVICEDFLGEVGIIMPQKLKKKNKEVAKKLRISW